MEWAESHRTPRNAVRNGKQSGWQKPPETPFAMFIIRSFKCSWLSYHCCSVKWLNCMIDRSFESLSLFRYCKSWNWPSCSQKQQRSRIVPSTEYLLLRTPKFRKKKKKKKKGLFRYCKSWNWSSCSQKQQLSRLVSSFFRFGALSSRVLQRTLKFRKKKEKKSSNANNRKITSHRRLRSRTLTCNTRSGRARWGINDDN